MSTATAPVRYTGPIEEDQHWTYTAKSGAVRHYRIVSCTRPMEQIDGMCSLENVETGKLAHASWRWLRDGGRFMLGVWAIEPESARTHAGSDR